MIAQMQLENFVVDQLAFKAALDDKEPSKGLIGVDFEVKAHAKDKDRFLIRMQVDLNKGQAFKKNGGYQVQMQIVGWFKFEKDVDGNTKKKMLYTNATSILYGVARTVVAQLSGTLGTKKFILPAVNLLEIARRKSASLDSHVKR